MLNPALVNRVLSAALEGGADFAEVFVEDTETCELGLLDSKPSTAVAGRLRGAGIRLLYGTDVVYVTTSQLDESGLLQAARKAAQARRTPGTEPGSVRNGGALQGPGGGRSPAGDGNEGRSFVGKERSQKLDWLRRLDQAARGRSSSVVQVEPSLMEKDQRILIANSHGLWAEDRRPYSRIYCQVTLEDQGARQGAGESRGQQSASSFLEGVDLEGLAHAAVDRASLLIHADYAPAGDMPVIIDHGFGGVIFHEACGHGLETTSVAKGASVFCGKLGQKIAHESVTAIDDGTIDGSWGSIAVDDEGMPTRKTVLIEKGVLKSYIADQVGSLKTGYERTGSGRRQSYRFAPASRMRNTYIAAGTDNLESMIRDMDYGLYARKMGGGSVNPGTGDYNFAVSEGYIVRNGRIEKPVKGATLIGRGIETLGRITRVAENLSLEVGMCGSVSGSIPVTVGQPAILVSQILVGGRAQS